MVANERKPTQERLTLYRSKEATAVTPTSMVAGGGRRLRLGIVICVCGSAFARGRLGVVRCVRGGPGQTRQESIVCVACGCVSVELSKLTTWWFVALLLTLVNP